MKNYPRIEIVCVGSELLAGRVNTHVSYLGARLADLGLRVACEQTVPDERPLMAEIFRAAFKRSDIVISCGGLGPTFDDITRDVWASVTGRSLRPSKKLQSDIQSKFSARGIVMPRANLRQADVLRGARSIPNLNGTAPGQILRLRKKWLILLPGPSRELYPMFERSVFPLLSKTYTRRYSRLKSFLIAGVPESKIDELIRPLVETFSHYKKCSVTHGILASQSLITVKFRVDGGNRTQVVDVERFLTRRFRNTLGELVVGEDKDAMEDVVGDLLEKRGLTVAVAESCTGGLIAKMLTDRPGASRYFLAGVVTYSNAAKTRVLGVPQVFFRSSGPGAVSSAVARAMAVNVRKKFGADFGVSVTGVAGPGGQGRKPVGLVYIACASQQGAEVKEFNFNGDRSWIRQRSAVMALDLLRQQALR